MAQSEPLTPAQKQILWALLFSLTVSGLYVFFAVWSRTREALDAAAQATPTALPSPVSTPL
jgi:hypothetical protein